MAPVTEVECDRRYGRLWAVIILALAVGVVVLPLCLAQSYGASQSSAVTKALLRTQNTAILRELGEIQARLRETGLKLDRAIEAKVGKRHE